MNLRSLLEIRKAIPTSATIGSIETRYKMAKLLKSTEPDYSFYIEQYQAIMNECALRKEDGSMKGDESKVAIDPTKVDKFIQSMKELDATTVDEPCVKFSMEELSPFELSVEALLALDPIIE